MYNVAKDHTMQDIIVSTLRLYLSAKSPATNDVNANSAVNAVDAKIPYCTSVNCKSMFIALLAAASILSRGVEKSTRYDIEYRLH